MKNFYSLGIERKSKEVLIESVIEYDELKLLKNNLVFRQPFKTKLSEGSIFYDILGYQDTANFAISERLYFLLKENNITGWKFYEIEIEGIGEKYYGFQVIGKCGKLNIPKTAGFYTGYKFDYDTWDNSDFFSPDDTALIFCTEKVQILFKQYNITNAELISIDTIEVYSVG